jgi:DNA-binding LacI/PurR family transcriptional regulator
MPGGDACPVWFRKMNGRAKAPTMRDVARLASVSVQTVSLVVNGKAEITEETRLRVRSAITQLQYQPHAAAQSLRSGRTGNIGLLVPDIHNPFFWGYVQGVEEVALQSDYSLFLTATNLDPAVEQRALRSLTQQRVDGLILLLTFPHLVRDEIAALKHTGKPMASCLPELTDDAVWVNYDVLARKMMDHLVALGHRRIGLLRSVGPPEDAAERVLAYREALAACGETVDERLIVRCRPTVEDTAAAAEQLLGLRPRPTAILGICDLAAFSAMQAAMRCGLRIPDDISIAGFDDIDSSCYLHPGLTTGQGRALENGRMLATMLLERIAQPDLPPRHVALPADLVIRGSTGPCPVAPVEERAPC